MTNKPFDINGLGTCLVGTYTIRHLTKYFKCNPSQLFFIAIEAGNQLEFYSYLLKFAYENALIQQKGLEKFKEMPVEEIDMILDEFPLSTADDEKISTALCMNIFGMTAKEFSEKINGKTEEQTKEDSDKKKVIGLTIGEESTNLLGATA
jgi:hypothetical protein